VFPVSDMCIATRNGFQLYMFSVPHSFSP
jgi:hypothetical protein